MGKASSQILSILLSHLPSFPSSNGGHILQTEGKGIPRCGLGPYYQFSIIRPDLAITEPMLLQHFYCGLSKGLAQHLDITFGGAFLCLPVSERKWVLTRILENTLYTNVDDPIPKREEIFMAKTPPILSKNHAIHPEPQISKEEEIQPSKHPYKFEEDLFPDFADYGNTLNYHFQKRPSKKLRSKPLKEGSLQKHPKSSSSHPSKPQVGHRTAKEMSSKPIEGESKH